MRLRVFALFVLLIAAGCRTPQPARQKEPQRIAAVLPYQPAGQPDTEEGALERAGFQPGAVGFALIDAHTGEVLAEREAHKGFMPGSVGKLPTAIAALQTLPERFETSLFTAGELRDGELVGDLYLLGGGDPELSAAGLMDLAQRLRAAGVQRLRGRLFYDVRRFPAVDRIEGSQDDDAAYDPALSALALDQNRVAVRWLPAPSGGVSAWSVPAGAAQFELGDDGQPTHFARRSGEGERWALSPRLPPSGEERLPVAHPAQLAARTFAELARFCGIALPAPAEGAVPEGARRLAMHQSAPLLELVRTTLLSSSNPMAEMLLLAFARQQLGRAPAGLREAAQALEDFWRDRLPKDVFDNLHLENGSGLSPATRLSPLQATGMLRHAARELPSFFTLLPASGLSGTLARRLRTPEVALRAWAKTGSMAYGNGLAGHLFSSAGRELIFAILVAEPERRATAYAARPRSPAETAARDAAEDAWTARSRGLQDDLVSLWIARY